MCEPIETRIRTVRSDLSRTPSNASSGNASGGEGIINQAAQETEHQSEEDEDEDEDEAFEYPGDESSEREDAAQPLNADGPAKEHDEQSDEDEFRYPDSPGEPPAEVDVDEGPSYSRPQSVRPSPAQLEALYAAGLSGDIGMLQKLINNATASGELEAFALVNDASQRTGLTVVHAAASRGHVSVVKWCKSCLSSLSH